MSRLKRVMLAVALFLVYGQVAVGPVLADSHEKVVSDTIPPKPRILVLQFQNMTRIHGINNTLRGPLTRKVFVTSSVAARSELIMDAVLMELFSQQTRIKTQLPGDVDAVVMQNDVQGAELIKALQSLGQKNRSEAVVVGYLYGYRDRVGGAFGAETSARVAFELVLVDVESGGIMWRRGISETQQPLNENLLDIGKFIRRKGRWVTAREMSRQAMQVMLQSFPYFQPLNKTEEAGVE